MNSFIKASNLFKTSFEPNDFFESVNASYVKSNITRAIDTEDIPLIFLLGEPGVGKTYMINLIKDEYKFKKTVMFSSDPFSSPESLLYFLLKYHVIDKSLSLSELKERLISVYKDLENIIIIDEAQLLNSKTLEYIRILSDTGYFKFLISMHKKEGEDILKKKHFSSRPHAVLYLEKLESNEILKYIHAQLFRHSLGELTNLFSMKQVKQLEKYSHGNFRMVKQLVKHIFLIMDSAKDNGLKKYTKPTKCVITMSAIDLGFLNV